MLVGKPPFVAEGAGELIAQHMFELPVAPSARGIQVSPDLEVITMRLLEKEPADRYASASEVVDALGRVLQRLDIKTSMRHPVAPPPGETLIVPAQTPSRLPLIAGALTAIVAGAAAVLIARGIHRDAPQKPEPPPLATPQPVAPPPAPPAPDRANVEPTVQQLVPPADPPKPVVKKPKHLTTANGSPIEDKL